MPQLSLTDFVDIVSTSGIPKATKIRQIKKRLAYNPATDFYKRIREDIIEAHQSSRPKSYLDRTLIGLTDPKKRTAYPSLVSEYKKWWGNKTLIWFDPPQNMHYSKHGVNITVNPELGLTVNGISHIIKLYFKLDPLAKSRGDIITHLMSITSSNLNSSISNPIMSIFDVRRGKLISSTSSIANLTNILDAELAYISSIWPTL